jgi:hypothetical protein
MKSANYRLTSLASVFDAQASNTVSANLKTKHFDHIMFQVGTAALTDGTLKVRGSIDKDTDLTAVQSVSNIWDYKYVYNLNSATGAAGSTGFSLGASAYGEFKVNVDGMYNMAFELTGMTAGAYTLNAYGVNKFGT